VVVGGAVLTAEVAAAMGADRYCKDPMEAVRFANEVLGSGR
jgi:5-methyltetrahydrofolate--homocysteine methyltransferase